MPRIILKCLYLKGGTKKASSHLSNLVTYMATRNGVEKLTEENKNLPATVKQENLIKQIIKEFPTTKNLFEYEDYIENNTIENASEFIEIALEQNLNKIGKRKNYVDYIANRPRVERLDAHGLFTGGDDKLILSKIAEEVANHTGNVWTPIISLRREDAVSTGFDKAETWHNMLSYYAPEIAESMKIPIENFQWYAAFHNESHHPHIHMVCYSVNPKDGYLTKKGIEKMKSGLVKNIFKNEIQEIYIEQSQRRDKLKAESKELLLKLISEMKLGTIQNPKIEELFLALTEKLKYTKGKRVYGYLQPNIKLIVDEIVDELSKDKKVAKAYKLWYEMRNEVLHSYMDTLLEPFPLSKQKEFKSIKNMIIAEADKIAKSEISFEEIENEETVYSDSDFTETDNLESFNDSVIEDFEPKEDEDQYKTDTEIENAYVKWTNEYKEALDYLFGTEEIEQNFEKALVLFMREADNDNALAMYDVGRIYADGLGVEIDTDKAHNYYVKTLSAFQLVESKKAWKYTEYRIGKMFAQGLGTEQDYKKAAQWFRKSGEKKYKYAQYSLGGLYYQGQGVEQDFKTSFDFYLKSAKQGFPYADFEVAKMYYDGVGTAKNIDESNIHFVKAFIGFENLEKQGNDDKLQYRIGWMLQNGIGTEKDILRAKGYFEKSAKLENAFACYSLAKLILAEDNPSEEEIQKAVSYLQTASDNENQFAQYSLGKIFLEGKHISKDIPKVIQLLTLSSEQGNEYAAYMLGMLYLKNEEIPKNIEKSILFLTQAAYKNNEWANYQLGKLFLICNDIPKDAEIALKYLLKSAEKGNQFAQYALGKIYLLGKDAPKDKETAIKWFTLSAEQGNEYAKFFLDNINKFREPSVVLSASRMLHNMSKIFEDNMPLNKSEVGLKIDSKLLRKLRDKKVSQGYKRDDYEQSMSL